MPRLLVVDDEPSVCAFVQDYFSPKGYDVIPAAPGKEELRRLREDRAPTNRSRGNLVGWEWCSRARPRA